MCLIDYKMASIAGESEWDRDNGGKRGLRSREGDEVRSCETLQIAVKTLGFNLSIMKKHGQLRADMGCDLIYFERSVSGYVTQGKSRDKGGSDY